MTDNLYGKALDEAERQSGPVVLSVVCEACGEDGRRTVMATVSKRPRGLFYSTERESLDVLGFEMMRRRAARGGEVPARFRALLDIAGGRESRVSPAKQRWRALLDHPDTQQAGDLPAWCSRHGEAKAHVSALIDLVRAADALPVTVPLDPRAQ